MGQCKQNNCEKEAIGEAYYPGIDKWHPYCQDHYDTRPRMKRRKFSEEPNKHHFIENENGWVHLTVGEETYMFPCPHCNPSYLTYKPEIAEASTICVNAGSDTCKGCFEPGCELASSNSQQLRTGES